MTKIAETIKLDNGIEMPRVGLGVWKIKNSEVDQPVLWALKSGYRLIDTAKVYGNEEGVGNGIIESGLPREKIFVTTKLSIYDLFRPEKAFEESLQRLKLDYVDLYLIHWPFIGWRTAWKGLEKIYKSGRAKAIGVSNFGIKQIEEIKRFSNIAPMANEVEITAGKTTNLEVALQAVGTKVGGPFGAIAIEKADRDAVLLNGKTPDFFVGHGDEFNTDFLWWKQELVVPPGAYQVTVLGGDKEIWSGSVNVPANRCVIIDVPKGVKKTVSWKRGEKLSSVPRFTAGVASATVAVAKPTAELSTTVAQLNCGDSSQIKWTSSDAPKIEISPGGFGRCFRGTIGPAHRDDNLRPYRGGSGRNRQFQRHG